MEIGLNLVDRDETEVKEDIKKKGKKEELEDLENKVEITQQVSAKQPPLSCFALSTIIVLFRVLLTAAVVAQSVERVDCRAGGCRLDSWGRTNTQGLKITEK